MILAFFITYMLTNDALKAMFIAFLVSIGTNMSDSFAEQYIPVRFDTTSTIATAKVAQLKECGIKIRHDDAAPTMLVVDAFGAAVVEGQVNAVEEWKKCGVTIK